jgi:hypothetical protein
MKKTEETIKKRENRGRKRGEEGSQRAERLERNKRKKKKSGRKEHCPTSASSPRIFVSSSSYTR